MNTKQQIVLNSLFVLTVISIGIIANLAFGDHETAIVDIGLSSSNPGCQDTKDCYIPYQVSVDVGGEVTWMNVDGQPHTVTSGLTPFPGIDGDGPSGVFDSGLFMPDESFSHQFESAGEFPYYCIVHPWMEGVVIVQETGNTELVPAKSNEEGSEETGNTELVPAKSKGEGSEESEYAPGTLVVGAPSEEETTVTGISDDGSIRAEITASNPKSGEEMNLEIKFRDSNDGSVKEHANYDLVVLQNGKELLLAPGEHAHEGTSMYSTPSLDSSDQVDIKVTLLGFGLPDDESNWSGPKGEILMFNVVPEFGTFAIIIMFVAISAVVLMSSRHVRVFPRF